MNVFDLYYDLRLMFMLLNKMMILDWVFNSSYGDDLRLMLLTSNKVMG